MREGRADEVASGRRRLRGAVARCETSVLEVAAQTLGSRFGPGKVLD